MTPRLRTLARLAARRVHATLLARADAGMSTAEYAVGTIAPVGRLIRSQRPVFTGLHCVSPTSGVIFDRQDRGPL